MTEEIKKAAEMWLGARDFARLQPDSFGSHPAADGISTEDTKRVYRIVGNYLHALADRYLAAAGPEPKPITFEPEKETGNVGEESKTLQET